MPRIILFTIALLVSQSFGLDGMRCGTLLFLEDLKNPKKRMLAKESNCASLDVDVFEEKTPNFIIYYTREGPHRIQNNKYIPSLALYLEEAYNLHKDSLGMKSISGLRNTTYHYGKPIPNKLYPVEVINISLLCGYEGDPKLSETIGLTFPDTYSPEKTEIIVKNNLSLPILKATTFHELYHAFQFTYNAIYLSTFWLEASATGVEEIGAPEVNDYIQYLPYNFRNPGKSMESIERSSLEAYSWVVLYLFLYSQIGPRFDSAIWNYFYEHPKDNFAMQLARLVDSLQKNHNFDKDAESLFHEYARQVFYSGNRAKFSQELFWPDMPKWPDWEINTIIPSVFPSGAIDFIRTEPNTAYNVKKSSMQYGDSTIWVLSRLLEKKYVAPTPAKEMVAYPNPWNPRKNQGSPEIHFKNLPEKSKGVEIRSANGALLARIAQEGDSLTWKPEKIPAPGILYYRALPYGKNKVLILQY
jgi:hypothetical protein